MGTIIGNANRARDLARLFEAWRRAFDRQDHAAMRRARRAIDAALTGDALCALDVAAVGRFAR
jgi:hypothetical protein